MDKSAIDITSTRPYIRYIKFSTILSAIETFLFWFAIVRHSLVKIKKCFIVSIDHCDFLPKLSVIGIGSITTVVTIIIL